MTTTKKLHSTARVALNLNLVHTINTDNILPEILSCNSKFTIIGVAARKQRKLTIFKQNESSYDVIDGKVANDDHTKEITSIAYLESQSLFATVSMDGTVKIWHSFNNSLVREIQFNEPLYSVEFANPRGDLLVSTYHQVQLVKIQDYFTASLLDSVLKGNWEDDTLEDPNFYDQNSYFWQKNKYSKTVTEAPYFLNAQFMTFKKEKEQLDKISHLEKIIMKTAVKRTDELEEPLFRYNFDDDSNRPEQEVVFGPGIAPDVVPKEEVKKERIFDDLEATIYVEVEMNLDVLMKSEVSPKKGIIMKPQSEEAVKRLENRRQIKLEKQAAEKAKLAAILEEKRRKKSFGDLAKPNSIISQGKPHVLPVPVKIIKRKPKVPVEEERRDSLVEEEGNRFAIDVDIAKEIEAELHDNHDSSSDDLSYESSESTSDSNGETYNADGGYIADDAHSVSKSERKSKRANYTHDQDDSSDGHESIDSKSGEVKKRSKSKKRAAKKEMSHKSTSSNTKKVENSVFQKILEKTFEKITGSYYEAEYKKVEYYMNPNPKIHLDSMPLICFSDEVNDPRNGYVKEEEHAAVSKKRVKPLAEIRKPTRRELLKQQKLEANSKPSEEGEEKGAAEDEERPITPIDTSVLLTKEEKSKAAWAIFQAAMTKSTEKENQRLEMLRLQEKENKRNKLFPKLAESRIDQVHLYNASHTIPTKTAKNATSKKVIIVEEKEQPAQVVVQSPDIQTFYREQKFKTFQLDIALKENNDYFGKRQKRIKMKAGTQIERNTKNAPLFSLPSTISYQSKTNPKDNTSKEESVTLKTDAVMEHLQTSNRDGNAIYDTDESFEEYDSNDVFEMHEKRMEAKVKSTKEGESFKPSREFSSLDEKGVSLSDQSNTPTVNENLSVKEIEQSKMVESGKERRGIMRKSSRDGKDLTHQIPKKQIPSENIIHTQSNQKPENSNVTNNSVSKTVQIIVEEDEEEDELKIMQVNPPEQQIYQSLFNESPIDTSLIKENIKKNDWFEDLSGKQVTIGSILESLGETMMNPNQSDQQKIDAVMAVGFLIETFSSDFKGEEEKVEKLAEIQVNLLMSKPSDRLKVQIIRNLGLVQVGKDFIVESLIVQLASNSKSVVQAALEALGNYGVNTSEDLENKMNDFQMFPDFKVYIRQKFIHPLDVRFTVVTLTRS